MRFLRWWLAEHTDIGHTAPTAVMLFADQGDPDHPESWPPADADSRVYRLPCHQTGCAELHDVRPVSTADAMHAINPGPAWSGSSPELERLAWGIADQLAARGLLTDRVPDAKVASRILAGIASATGCQGLDQLPETIERVVEGKPRIGPIKQLTVWMPLSGVAAGLPAGWTCPGCGMADVGRHYPHTLVVCAHCTRVVRDLRGPAEEVQVSESSRAERMSGGVS